MAAFILKWICGVLPGYDTGVIVRNRYAPLPVGRGRAKALKIGIERPPPGIAAMLVDPVRVALPNFDPVALPPRTILTGNAAHKVENLS